MTSEIRTRSGRPLVDLTIEMLRAGALSGDDFSISREQLEAQAVAAEASNHRQLADNLRRAAELTGLSNERVFAIYELLRPGRASFAELTGLARELTGQNMPRLALFVSEAAEAYRARGVARTEE
jgi:propanediol dehydratase small subunit